MFISQSQTFIFPCRFFLSFELSSLLSLVVFLSQQQGKKIVCEAVCWYWRNVSSFNILTLQQIFFLGAVSSWFSGLSLSNFYHCLGKGKSLSSTSISHSICFYLFTSLPQDRWSHSYLRPHEHVYTMILFLWKSLLLSISSMELENPQADYINASSDFLCPGNRQYAEEFQKKITTCC